MFSDPRATVDEDGRGEVDGDLLGLEGFDGGHIQDERIGIRTLEGENFAVLIADIESVIINEADRFDGRGGTTRSWRDGRRSGFVADTASGAVLGVVSGTASGMESDMREPSWPHGGGEAHSAVCGK